MEDMDRRRLGDHWSFDKRIPIAMILAMLVQCGAAIWWVSDLNSRVHGLEKDSGKSQTETISSNTEMASVKERVLRLEIKWESIDLKLNEIKELIAKKH